MSDEKNTDPLPYVDRATGARFSASVRAEAAGLIYAPRPEFNTTTATGEDKDND